MHRRRPPTDKVLLRAAEARATGKSWATIAKLVRRSPHTVVKWPSAYPERWEAGLRIAARAAIDLAAAQGVAALQNLLISKDEKIRTDAAWRLLCQRLEQWKIDKKPGGSAPQTSTNLDAHRIADYTREHTDAQLAAIFASVFKSQLPVAGVPPGSPGPRSA